MSQGGWKRAASRLDGEEQEREETREKLIPLPNEFLNDAIGGVAPNDLILLCARTGEGKTHFAVTAMLDCARRGFKVGFMSLESEPREIERRTKYQILSNLFYASPDRRSNDHLRYQDWRYGNQSALAKSYNEAANMETKRALHNVFTLYRETGIFTVSNFVERFDEIKKYVDLIICDHLHYFDHDSEDDNRGVKRIVQTIRDTAVQAGKPVIMLAHVRKGERPRYQPLVPTIDDIHGSSDIAKNCTKIIMTAPVIGMETEPFVRPTYFTAVKCRTSGDVTRYSSICYSDDRTGRYSQHYDMGKFVEYGTKFQPLKGAEMPRWAKWGRPGNDVSIEEGGEYGNDN